MDAAASGQGAAYGLKALDRALDGVTGTIAIHLCFGYAAVVHDKPSGYSFLPELEGSKVQQVSIEAAQPDLDLKVLRQLPSKTIMLGVISLADMTIETPQTVAARIRRAFDHVPPERVVVAPDCGMKYLPREVAFGKMQAMVEGAKIVRRELAPNRPHPDGGSTGRVSNHEAPAPSCETLGSQLLGVMTGWICSGHL